MLIFSSFANQVNIIGTTKPKNPKINDLVFNKDDNYEIFCGDNWVECATIATNTTCDAIYKPKVEYRELKPSICFRCGAPLRNNKCEYCDTEYR